MWSWFKNQKTKWSSGNPTTANLQTFLSGYASTSGEIISPKSILSNPACLQGIRAISTYCSRVPFDVYKRTNPGRTRANNHKAQRVLKNPSKFYSPLSLISAWVVNALTFGNGYIWVIRDDFGRPVELVLLDSSSTTIAIDGDQILYATMVNSQWRKIQGDDVCHLKGLSDDGITGLPLWKILADAYGLGLTLQRYQNLFFKNNGKPSLIIHLPPEANTKEDIEKFREAWGNVHSGIENAHRPALLRPGATITTIGNSNDANQVAELRESDLVTVANCLGIPSYVVGGKSNVSYKSLTEERLNFLDAVDYWVSQIESEFSRKLLREDQQTSFYIEANRKRLIQITPEVEAKLLIDYRANGLLSDEECREALNRPVSFEGTFWTQSGLVPREQALKEPEPPQEPTPDEPEAQEAEPEIDNQLAKKTTEKSISRLIRRAEKSHKIDLEIWRDEFDHLPGFQKLESLLPIEELTQVLPEQSKYVLDQIDTKTINEELWKAE